MVEQIHTRFIPANSWPLVLVFMILVTSAQILLASRAIEDILASSGEEKEIEHAPNDFAPSPFDPETIEFVIVTP